MPTPAYTNFQAGKPDGTTGTGATFAADALAQLATLRDSVVSHHPPPGWTMTLTQGTGPDLARPQYTTWLNATLSLGFRLKVTWGGTGTVQLGTVEWEWSNDNGSSWTTMGTAQANTYDANDNITNGTNGGMITRFFELWTKVLRLVTNLAAHIAGTGTGVHGLGSMSTQSAGSVAITGGSADGMAFGVTTKAQVGATRVVEARNVYTPGAGAGVALDWTNGNSYVTNNGTNAVTFSNVPATGQFASHCLRVSNLDTTTFPAAVTWGAGGKPPCNGEAWVFMWTVDGGTTVYAGLSYQAV
jgi:hypothetical protein